MKKTHPIVTGTLILTATGMFSRLIGFFYRIYLSRLFGEEGMGIYQLLGPVTSLTFSLSAAGLQTAISKHVAAETSGRNYRASVRVLFTGLFLSLFLSALCTWVIHQYSHLIATKFLLEERTDSMLRIIALSIPLGAVHSCINGYFYGIKKTGIPSATQLAEQLCRVACVYLACIRAEQSGTVPNINAAVLGLVIGEGFAMLISLLAVFWRFRRLARENPSAPDTPLCSPFSTAKVLLNMAVPLSLTRIIINLLQSVEAIFIPNKLQAFGYDSAGALSVYGVLTGMAMPLIFFPGAVTNSICVLLLPVVSEADENGNVTGIRRAASLSLRFCCIFGSLCTLLFLLFGRFAGNFLFHSTLAGKFIVTLSFICPFLYLSATMSSILHGMGKTAVTFVLNVTALGIRLLFVFFVVPRHGIEGYLHGLLLSHLSTTLLEIWSVKYYLRKRENGD